ADSTKSPIRVPPRKLAVVEFCFEKDLISAILWNLKTEMRGVRGTGGNQMNVSDGTRGPGVAFVDPVAMLIEPQRTIEVRAPLNWPFAVVFDFPAPKNDLPLVVHRL